MERTIALKDLLHQMVLAVVRVVITADLGQNLNVLWDTIVRKDFGIPYHASLEPSTTWLDSGNVRNVR